MASPSTSASGPALSSATWRANASAPRLEPMTLPLGAAQGLLGVALSALGLVGTLGEPFGPGAPTWGARP